MSGVRNLRAMFEQKGENNPPDRGRSPGLSVGSPSPTQSPRPLSKVRTTFVAIEKDGIVGLRREPSGDSVSIPSRRASDEADAITPQPVPEKPSVIADNMAKDASVLKTKQPEEVVPEPPKPAAPPKPSPKKESESPKLAPNPNPDKVTDEEEPKTKLLPGNPTEKTATRGTSATPTGRTTSTNGKTKSAAVNKPAPKATPVSTSAKSVSKAPKSPNTMRPTNSTTKLPTNAPSLAPQKKAAPASSKEHDAPKKTAAPTVAKATATSSKKPAPVELPPSGTGFVKPKPKSPTRPIKLPTSLTAPTASSASKLGNGSAAHPPRQSLSRASGNAQHLNVAPTTHRPPSRASLSAVNTTTNVKGLKRQNSTVGRSRPSLGPPPKQTAKDHPVVKKDGHVDESFLARMMRPTQSSSSKTSDKAAITPPRKQSAPSTAHKKPAAKDVEGSAKKAATKIQSSTNKAKAAVQGTKPAKKVAPTAKEVAPVVAQTETAEAAIETAKVSSDTATSTSSDAEAEQKTADQESKDGSEGDATEKSFDPTATKPTIAQDPEKVEDIEDVVQGATEESAAGSETNEVQEEQSGPEVNDEATLV